jgi:hypothetical protein
MLTGSPRVVWLRSRVKKPCSRARHIDLAVFVAGCPRGEGLLLLGAARLASVRILA